MAQPDEGWQQTLTPYASPGVDLQNLHTSFATHLVKALQAGPDTLHDRRTLIDSGYRNSADQKAAIAQIWHMLHGAKPVPDNVYKTGIPGLVAGIGRSAHAHGAAVDMPGLNAIELKWFRKHGPDFGIVPLAGKAQKSDPYHFQAIDAYSLPIKDVPHVAIGRLGPKLVPIDAPMADLTFPAITIIATIVFLLTRLRGAHEPEQADAKEDVPARAARVA